MHHQEELVSIYVSFPLIENVFALEVWLITAKVFLIKQADHKFVSSTTSIYYGTVLAFKFWKLRADFKLLKRVSQHFTFCLSQINFYKTCFPLLNVIRSYINFWTKQNKKRRKKSWKAAFNEEKWREKKNIKHNKFKGLLKTFTFLCVLSTRFIMNNNSMKSFRGTLSSKEERLKARLLAEREELFVDANRFDVVLSSNS